MRSIAKILAVATVVCAGAPAAAETLEVTVGILNVRTGPSTRYAKIGQTSRPKRYTVLARSGSWAKVQYGSRPAWLYAPYTRTVVDPPSLSVPPATADVRVVTARALNVRTGPSTRYRRIRTISRGTRVSVIGSQGRWLRIRVGTVTGWSHGAYFARAGAPPSTPNPGTRPTSGAGFIQMKASGPGFYTYQAGYRRWAKPELIYGVERAGRKWQASSSGLRPSLGIGDISRENGGRFSPHVSHRYGVDMDARPLRKDTVRAGVTITQSAYSRANTQAYFDILRSELNVKLILFNDRNVRGRQYYRGHSNHFHLRIYR
jgi:uncharacterized protein YraI